MNPTLTGAPLGTPFQDAGYLHELGNQALLRAFSYINPFILNHYPHFENKVKAGFRVNKYIRPKLCPSETLRLTVNQVITDCFMGKHLQF